MVVEKNMIYRLIELLRNSLMKIGAFLPCFPISPFFINLETQSLFLTIPLAASPALPNANFALVLFQTRGVGIMRRKQRQSSDVKHDVARVRITQRKKMNSPMLLACKTKMRV